MSDYKYNSHVCKSARLNRPSGCILLYTGRYFRRIPDDLTLSLTNNHDGENNKVDPQILLDQLTAMHNP